MNKLIAIIVGLAIVLSFIALWSGWLVMLIFAILHSIAPAVPAIGFGWQVIGLGLLISAITGGSSAAQAVNN